MESQKFTFLSYEETEAVQKVLEMWDNGIEMVFFLALFSQWTGKELDFKAHGFEDFVDLVVEHPHVFKFWVTEENNWMLKSTRVNEKVDRCTIKLCIVPHDVPAEGATFTKQPLYQFEQRIGMMFTIFITSAMTPCHFFGIIAEAYNTYHLLMHELQKFYGNEEFSRHYRIERIDLRTSMVCAVYDSLNGLWHRGVIMSFPSAYAIQVFNVDRGTYVTVSKADIRYMKNDFLETMVQSMPGRLYGVMRGRNNVWTVQEKSIFERLALGKELKARICRIKCGRVEMELSSLDGSCMIKDVLMAQRHMPLNC